MLNITLYVLPTVGPFFAVSSSWGCFQLLSCTNIFGEILKWFGFTVASWNSCAATFLFFTTANLTPRAHYITILHLCKRDFLEWVKVILSKLDYQEHVPQFSKCLLILWSNSL